MNLKTVSRVSAALGAACTVVAGVLTFVVPSASALEQDRVTLVPEQTQVVDYGPLIGNNPGAQVDASTTINEETCLANPACDIIPMTIPDPGSDDDFFVRITLNWQTSEIPNVPLLGDTATNDLDMWLVNDPFNPDAGPDEDGFAYKSAGAGEPERVDMYRPIGNWKIFIVNASGVNVGYKLTFEWTRDRLPVLFESVPPVFSGGAPVRPAAPPTTALPAAPSVDVVEAAPVAPVQPVKPDLTLGAAVAPDASFGSSAFSDAPSLDEQLAAPALPQTAVQASTIKPAPPSTAAVLLWMVGIPLLLIAVGGTLLARRQASMLQISA